MTSVKSAPALLVETRATCPNSIVYSNVRTHILASSGQNKLGKKFLRKNQHCWSTFVF